jgi:hypothetical protein
MQAHMPIDPALVRTGYTPNLGECASCMILSAYKLPSARCLVLTRFAVVRFSFATNLAIMRPETPSSTPQLLELCNT